MKKYLIFDLDGTLIQSDQQISEIIYTYIREKIDPELIEKGRYIIENNQGMSIQEGFTLLLDGDEKQAQIHTDIIYSEINNIENTVKFFPGVIKKIQELSNKYTLFLSTGNSDEFANEILKKGGIHNCFDKILGSTHILKSTLHIDQFIDYTGDENFSKKSIFIGDGQRDKEIASAMNIDFIHVGNIPDNIYEIKSVIDINPILEKLDT